MDSNNRILDKFEGYLTPEASEVIAQAEKAGMDRDLAIATLESMWPSSEIYSLEEPLDG